MGTSMPCDGFRIRRHPFNSIEAYQLISALDKDIVDVYPEYDPHDNLRPVYRHISVSTAAHSTQTSDITNIASSPELEEVDSLNSGLFFFIAFAEDQGREMPVGCVALRLLTPLPSVPQFIPSNVPSEFTEGSTYAEIKRFYVMPSHRCRGIAKALINHIDSFARAELKVDALVLEVGFRQTRAVELYRKAGFFQRSMYGEHVGMEPEAGGDSLCMEKALAEMKG